jgi:hypothetical protein
MHSTLCPRRLDNALIQHKLNQGLRKLWFTARGSR